jgi:hypothetical protein
MQCRLKATRDTAWVEPHNTLTSTNTKYNVDEEQLVVAQQAVSYARNLWMAHHSLL